MYIRRTLLRSGLCFAFTLLSTLSANAQGFIPRFLVQFDSPQAASAVALPDYVSKRQALSDSLMAIEVRSAEESKQLVAYLKQTPHIVYAEQDQLRYPNAQSLGTNDAYFNTQWNLAAVNAKAAGSSNAASAWSRLAGYSNRVVVAVIDTGINQHADLQQNLLPGYDFISEVSRSNDGDGWDADATDRGDFTSSYGSSWHGTAVSGVIAAQSNNAIGIAGVSTNIKILPIRVSGVGGAVVSDVVTGIRWAAGIPIPGVPINPNPAKVINLSLSTDSPCFFSEQAAINEVLALGVVVVGSAGNYGSKTLAAPANCEGVIAVTAATKEGDIATYSNQGTGATVSAPGGGFNRTIASSGDGIWSLSNSGKQAAQGDSYQVRMGTSFAAPHVAAAAAMLLVAKPDLQPNEVKDILQNSARGFASNTYCAANKVCGAGLLDINSALALIGVGPQLDPNATQPILSSPIAVTAPATGGGGCTVHRGKPDPFTFILLLLAILKLGLWKRKRSAFSHHSAI